MNSEVEGCAEQLHALSQISIHMSVSSCEPRRDERDPAETSVEVLTDHHLPLLLQTASAISADWAALKNLPLVTATIAWPPPSSRQPSTRAWPAP